MLNADILIKNLAANKKDPRKTWQLINVLNSCHHKRKTIAHIEIGDNKISSAADMAEAFNHHFAKISRMIWQEEYLW